MAAASWLFFRSARRTLAEHLVFNTYTFSHECLLISLFLVAVKAGAPEPLGALGLLVGMAYWGWAAVRFFGHGWLSGSVRAIAAMVVATVMSWTVLLAGVLGYVWIT
jgi:hypothetical protein